MCAHNIENILIENTNRFVKCLYLFYGKADAYLQTLRNYETIMNKQLYFIYHRFARSYIYKDIIYVSDVC